jgi:hypothetical protein
VMFVGFSNSRNTAAPISHNLVHCMMDILQPISQFILCSHDAFKRIVQRDFSQSSTPTIDLLRNCIQDLISGLCTSTNGDDIDESIRVVVDLLYFWHAIEIFLLDPNASIYKDTIILLQTRIESVYVLPSKETINDAEIADQPEEDQKYWQDIYDFVLFNQLESALDMLKCHSTLRKTNSHFFSDLSDIFSHSNKERVLSISGYKDSYFLAQQKV